MDREVRKEKRKGVKIGAKKQIRNEYANEG